MFLPDAQMVYIPEKNEELEHLKDLWLIMVDYEICKLMILLPSPFGSISLFIFGYGGPSSQIL